MKPCRILPVLVVMGILTGSCSILTSREKQLRQYSPTARLALPLSNAPESLSNVANDSNSVHKDTLTRVRFEGKDYIIMNAVKDENGEMVATDEIPPVYVVSSFKNVAERQGKVDLEFKIIVPEVLQYSKWQLRFFPFMEIENERTGLNPVFITGEQYRKAQLRGYQQYERFLSTIITDSTLLLYRRQLELFLKRNMPEIYSFKRDTNFVSEEDFRSRLGVCKAEAVRHYTNALKSSVNRFRISRKQLMFRKYVKSPIIEEGIRLDTVLRNPSGDFEYDYIQTIKTRPGLKKADIILSGEVFDQDRKVYSLPEIEPVSFYISSISFFVDDGEKYLEKIIERKANVNTACYVAFKENSSEIIEDYGNNKEEIGRIKGNFRDIIEDEEFDLDSIVVTASASPEGTYSHNRKLSEERSKSVSKYFKNFYSSLSDSIKNSRGIEMCLGGEVVQSDELPGISFISRSNPENWRMLDAIVKDDLTIGQKDKNRYYSLSSEKDPDKREKEMSVKIESYRYFRTTLYPRVRTVKFDFYLHRKGMIKDTLHTTEIDTAYMRAVQAIKDREYEIALKTLRPYHDYNAAVALCALDYNHTALEILEKLEQKPKVKYLEALVHSRLGDEAEAVNCFVEACGEDGSLIYRGNLDPEISGLIKKYKINNVFEQQ